MLHYLSFEIFYNSILDILLYSIEPKYLAFLSSFSLHFFFYRLRKKEGKTLFHSLLDLLKRVLGS